MALRGGREGGGELGDRAPAPLVSGNDRTVRMDEKHRVAKAAALADHHGKPAPAGVAASVMSPASTAHSMPPE